MAIKNKSEIKKKGKLKIVRKTEILSEKKDKPVKKISAQEAGKNKKSDEAQAMAVVHAERTEAGKKETSMVNDLEKTKDRHSAHLARWTAPNFILTNGEVLVYKLSAAGSPFMIVWSILQGSYIVSITFFLALGVSIMHLVRKPVAMECLIDLDGIKMGDKLYKYNQIESFEIDEEAKVLKFKLKNAFLPLKEVYLEDQNPNYIRAVLEYFLPEEKQEATLVSRGKNVSSGAEEVSDEEFLSYLRKMENKAEREDS